MRTRHFPEPPGRDEAVRLLYEISRQPTDCCPRKVDKPLAIYGAGAFGKLAKRYCDRLEIPICVVIDASVGEYRTDPFWAGVELFAPDKVDADVKSNSLLAICVGKSPYTEVTSPLVESGWVDVVPFFSISAAYMDQHPLGNGWFAGALDRKSVV